MARRNDHSREDLENLAKETAKKIVIEHGYGALTARKLAQEIGYTPGTLYNVFGSMDGLILAINLETLEGLEKALVEVIEKGGDPEKQIKSMAKIYIDFANSNRNLWLLVFDHSLPKGQKSPEWYHKKIQGLFTRLENVMGRDKASAIAARTLWSSVHGICYMAQTDKISLIGEYSPYEMADFLIDNFFRGLKT